MISEHVNAGRQFDLNGNRRMWWTNDSVKAFDERVSCFVDQYNNYKLNELSVSIGASTLYMV